MAPRIETKDGCCLCIPNGSLTLDEVDVVKVVLRSALDTKGLRSLLIDCEEMRMIDSSGIGLITSVFLTCRKIKVAFGICSLNTQVRESLQIVHLESVLPIYQDRKSALAALMSA